MPRIVASLLAFAAFAVAPLGSSAAPITLPTDLSVGDKYRLAFVTSTTRDATSSAILDYNNFVAAGVPELAALGTTWKAIGSTSGIAARDNTLTNPNVSADVPIYRLDDTRIASDNADLWDDTLIAPLSTNEFGQFLDTRAWTGSVPDGTVFGTVGLGGASSVSGFSTVTDIRWIHAFTEPADSPYSLYAMSGVLTVVP